MTPPKRALSHARRHQLQLALALITATCLLSALHFRSRLSSRLVSLRRAPYRTRCVRAQGLQNNEGLGQALLRNQFAVFMAELLSAQLQFPQHATAHGYELADFFDRCDAHDVRNSSRAQLRERCTLRKKQLLLRNCERGDCACVRAETLTHVRPLAEQCDVIDVYHDGFKTQEYSGCVSNVLKRYFGGRNRWRTPYDAVHYRQGDLQQSHNANDAWLYMLNNIISFMCKHSERDIVVVTQGEPSVPKCARRVVLAGNTSERESFAILQHAKWIGVENSGFGIAMMEISNPERVLMDTFVTKWYDWLLKPEWTVFNEAGGIFSFASGKDAIKAKYAGAGLEVRTIRDKSLKKFDEFETEVPARRWEKEALPLPSE